MKGIVRFSSVFFVIILGHVHASSDLLPLSRNDMAIVRAVLSDSAISNIISAWEIKELGRTIVMSDQTTACELPESEEENYRVELYMEGIAHGDDILASELKSPTPTPGKDIVVGKGKVIPGEVVDACLETKDQKRRVAPPDISGPLAVVLESHEFMEKHFRSEDPNPWQARHANAVGALNVSSPAYSRDGKVAGIYMVRLRTGLGGAGVFYFLENTGSSWAIRWWETVFIE
ncbi:MAG: hypothetical protein HYV63_20940 [Candidatus Schekmanbacteria bacterium]|nr:hypothetical protein [Candidatus Schekmanbacteria bacterium]